ncbi:serine hydrolase [Amycolatopsis sp. NPDC088138]|uniref:serine hydrolase n=1 Tax=Amycolatopsis sp. NPDC088138 TaxID=3363938 RepID=UPI0038064FCC
MTPLEWLVAASVRAPLPDDEIRAHIAPSLVDGSGGPAGINAALAAVGPLTIHAQSTDGNQVPVRGPAGDFRLTVQVDAAGLVRDLQLTPDEPKPMSWAEIDTRLTALGKRVSFAAAEIDGECRIVHGLDADTQRPIGSAFKLYVLGALGQAVAEGRASWDEPLAIRDEWKSLPSGTMQNHPAGTEFPLSEFADLMISISDNTATDHLIQRLGRDAVERQLSLFGHREPEANIPFRTTKEFFRIKAPTGQLWPAPIDIDEIEWFASPSDICRAYAGLLRLGQPEIGNALSRNDDGLDLDAAAFPSVWYKGGSEPGVVTLHYLVRTADGRAKAVSLMVSDPESTLDTLPLTTEAQSVIRGAFHLLA